MDNILVKEKIFWLIEMDAHKLQEDAEGNGSYSPVADQLREQLRYYQLGERGAMPHDWKKYEEKAKKLVQIALGHK